MVVRILDQIYLRCTLLRRAPAQPELAGQIGLTSKAACRDAARRVGLIPFVAEPGKETF